MARNGRLPLAVSHPKVWTWLFFLLGSWAALSLAQTYPYFARRLVYVDLVAFQCATSAGLYWVASGAAWRGNAILFLVTAIAALSVSLLRGVCELLFITSMADISDPAVLVHAAPRICSLLLALAIIWLVFRDLFASESNRAWGNGFIHMNMTSWISLVVACSLLAIGRFVSATKLLHLRLTVTDFDLAANGTCFALFVIACVSSLSGLKTTAAAAAAMGVATTAFTSCCYVLVSLRGLGSVGTWETSIVWNVVLALAQVSASIFFVRGLRL